MDKRRKGKRGLEDKVRKRGREREGGRKAQREEGEFKDGWGRKEKTEKDLNVLYRLLK